MHYLGGVYDARLTQVAILAALDIEPEASVLLVGERR